MKPKEQMRTRANRKTSKMKKGNKPASRTGDTALFIAAVEHAHDGVLFLNAQNQITYASSSVTKITGYQPWELVGNWDMEIFQLDAQGSGSGAVPDLVPPPGETSSHEYRLTHKDGSWVWVDIRTINLLNNLEVQAVILNLHDVTERRKAEQALRNSEALYRQAIEVAGAVPYYESYDQNRELINYDFIGEGIRQITGYGPDEFTGALWDTLVLDSHLVEDLEDYSFNDAIQRVRSGKNPIWKCEFRIKHRNGEIRWVFEAAVELRDERGIAYGSIGMYQDITTRKRAEEALRESESRFRSLIEDLQVGVLLQGPNAEILVSNKSALDLLGLTEAQILNRTSFDPTWEVIHEDGSSFPEADHPVPQAIATRKPVRGIVMGVYRPVIRDRVWLWVNAEPQLDSDGNVRQVICTFNDITARKDAEKKIRQQVERLTALREIDQFINSSFDMQLSLNALLLRASVLLKADAVLVLLVNPILNILEYGSSVGFRANSIQTTMVRFGDSHAGRVALTRQTIQIPNLAKEPETPFYRQTLKAEEFISYYGAPLIVKGKVVGVMEVFNRSFVERDYEWLEFFTTLAARAAIAIDNTKLYEGLQRSNQELSLAYEATIEGWSRALDLRDKETEGHTLRVTEKTLELARRMGIPSDQMLHVRRGALLHDIGKMGVPDQILLKADSLTIEEWTIMRQHPTFAFDLLTPIRYLKGAAIDIPYYHHEKWDGTGYPRGLKGEQIPLAARVFAVVDVWDALTNDRPYRKALSKEQALEYIRDQSGRHFDPQVVNEFMILITDDALRGRESIGNL